MILYSINDSTNKEKWKKQLIFDTLKNYKGLVLKEVPTFCGSSYEILKNSGFRISGFLALRDFGFRGNRFRDFCVWDFWLFETLVLSRFGVIQDFNSLVFRRIQDFCIWDFYWDRVPLKVTSAL